MKYTPERCTRHTSGDGNHHIPRVKPVEKYASDRCITVITQHHIPPLGFIHNSGKIVLTQNSLKRIIEGILITGTLNVNN